MRHYLIRGRGGRRQWRAGRGPGCRRLWRRGRRPRRWAGTGGVCSAEVCAALLRLLGHGRRKAVAGVTFGSAAPWIRARHCRVKIGGAAGPAPSAVAATSALCRATIHGAAQTFGRARAIGAAKIVSLKKIGGGRFKISFQKVLKLKKIAVESSSFVQGHDTA